MYFRWKFRNNLFWWKVKPIPQPLLSTFYFNWRNYILFRIVSNVHLLLSAFFLTEVLSLSAQMFSWITHLYNEINLFLYLLLALSSLCCVTLFFLNEDLSLFFKESDGKNRSTERKENSAIYAFVNNKVIWSICFNRLFSYFKKVIPNLYHLWYL